MACMPRICFAWPSEPGYRPLSNEVGELEPELINALEKLARLVTQTVMAYSRLAQFLCLSRLRESLRAFVSFSMGEGWIGRTGARVVGQGCHASIAACRHACISIVGLGGPPLGAQRDWRRVR